MRAVTLTIFDPCEETQIHREAFFDLDAIVACYYVDGGWGRTYSEFSFAGNRFWQCAERLIVVNGRFEVEP